MATRRPSFNTGKPSITTPRQLELRNVQQAIDAIRERFSNAEAQLLFLAGVADAATSGEAIASLSKQFSQLSQQVNVLAAQIEAIGVDSLGLSLSMEAKMWSVAQSAADQVPVPDSAHGIIANRVFRA